MHMAQLLLVLCVSGTIATPPRPTSAQLKMMEKGLAQFMHFSVDPWSSIEHNCVGSNPECIPSTAFNPTNLSTDQWVETAVAFGAKEICLTAHHEGGFCLWDTKFSNYSVMHSPYGKDVVKQFVASCKKYGVTPCYYMGPNANGYLSNELKVSAEKFVETQLGMLRELLTNYGTDYVSRLWWDHYPGGCGGLAPCPDGSFPAAWPKFVKLVRELSPSTIICPGPDCDGHQGESGIGRYPSWFPCEPETAPDGTVLKCGSHSDTDPTLTGFHPYEACATMHNGWFCKGNGTTKNNEYWSPSSIWDHYMKSVGIGWVNTLNAPPGTTGQIPQPLVDSMTTFGAALKQMLEPVGGFTATGTFECGNDTSKNFLELDLSKAPSGSVKFNAVMLRENLTLGQTITAYAIDYKDAQGHWVPYPMCSGDNCYPKSHASTHSIPTTPWGECGAATDNLNLVNKAPPSTHVAGVVKTADACKKLCQDDNQCNFWTWHDLEVVPTMFRGRCYVRHDSVYDYDPENHHVSGVCNHTLTPGAGEGGVHGQNVGSRMIDFVPETVTNGVRVRCTAGMQQFATVQSLSVHVAKRPSP